MVSTSTRRLPSTWIEGADWATAGDDTGMANMIRAANKPARTRIPTYIRHAPSSLRVLGRVQIWPKELGNISDRSKMLLDDD
jgi:hypothetical protein